LPRLVADAAHLDRVASSVERRVDGRGDLPITHVEVSRLNDRTG